MIRMAFEASLLVVLITDAWFTSGRLSASARSERFQGAWMTNRNKKSRITVVGSLHGMVCTRNRASHLLQGLRKDYQLLTPEERNQVECFLLGLYPNDTRRRTSPEMLKLEVEH
jgi:hypothetical protein